MKRPDHASGLRHDKVHVFLFISMRFISMAKAIFEKNISMGRLGFSKKMSMTSLH